MKTFLTTHHEIFFNFELNDVFDFKKKIYPLGTHLSEILTHITKTYKVHLKCNCVDGSIVNGR